MPLPKCEGQIIFTAAQTGTTNGGAGWSVPSGTYYWNTTNGANSALLTVFATALQTALGGGPLPGVTVDDATDAGTGRGTITYGGAGILINWTTTDLRDYLGFTGNLSQSTSHTATRHANYLWLPDVGRAGILAPEPATNATDLGVRERDLKVPMSPSGYRFGMSFNTRWKDTFHWHFVGARKAVIGCETYANESFEKFYEDVVGKCRAFRYHADRSNNSNRHWTMFIGDDAKEYVPRWRSEIRGATGGYADIEYMMRKAVGE